MKKVKTTTIEHESEKTKPDNEIQKESGTANTTVGKKQSEEELSTSEKTASKESNKRSQRTLTKGRKTDNNRTQTIREKRVLTTQPPVRPQGADCRSYYSHKSTSNPQFCTTIKTNLPWQAYESDELEGPDSRHTPEESEVVRLS